MLCTRPSLHCRDQPGHYSSSRLTLLFRHWPIGLIYDNHTISSTIRTIPTASLSQTTPLKLILHLASPPTDKLLLSPSAEACKQAFMGQLKEADFMRWGSTKRMTGLRKAEQDGMWEGVKDRTCFMLSLSADRADVDLLFYSRQL